MELWNPGVDHEGFLMTTTVILFTPKIFCFRRLFSFYRETPEKYVSQTDFLLRGTFVQKGKHGVWLTLTGPLRNSHTEYGSFHPESAFISRSHLWNGKISCVHNLTQNRGPSSNRINCAIAPLFLSLLSTSTGSWVATGLSLCCCYIKHGDQRQLKEESVSVFAVPER